MSMSMSSSESKSSASSSDISGFSICSVKFDKLPDGLTEEIYYADMMRRDTYYAERRIRKAREREIQQQQSQSGNNVGGTAASQDEEGCHRRGERQQLSPSDKSSSIGGLSTSHSDAWEGRDKAMERQIGE